MGVHQCMRHEQHSRTSHGKFDLLSAYAGSQLADQDDKSQMTHLLKFQFAPMSLEGSLAGQLKFQHLPQALDTVQLVPVSLGGQWEK